MKRGLIRKALLVTGVVIVLISLAALVYSLLPVPVQVEQFVLPSSLFTLPVK